MKKNNSKKTIRRIIHNKGVFFSVLAIFLSSLIITFFSADLETPLDRDVSIVIERVGFLHEYNAELKDNYFSRALYVTTYLALDELTKATKQKKLADEDYFNESEIKQYLNELLNEGIINITINSAKEEFGSNNNNINYWLDQIIELSEDKFKINLTYEILGPINISESHPFSVDVSFPIRYTIQDDFARITNSANITVRVSIIGLKDPLMYMESFDVNYYEKIIVKDPKLEIGSSVLEDLTNATILFKNHYYNQTYVTSPEGNNAGPSYLMRLQGLTTNSSCCGIQSLLNTSVNFFNSRSYVDFEHFQGNLDCDEIELFKIDGLPESFRITSQKAVNEYKIKLVSGSVCGVD